MALDYSFEKNLFLRSFLLKVTNPGEEYMGNASYVGKFEKPEKRVMYTYLVPLRKSPLLKSLEKRNKVKKGPENKYYQSTSERILNFGLILNA